MSPRPSSLHRGGAAIGRGRGGHPIHRGTGRKVGRPRGDNRREETVPLGLGDTGLARFDCIESYTPRVYRGKCVEQFAFPIDDITPRCILIYRTSFVRVRFWDTKYAVWFWCGDLGSVPPPIGDETAWSKYSGGTELSDGFELELFRGSLWMRVEDVVPPKKGEITVNVLLLPRTPA